MSPVTETQIGAIGESLVSTQLMLESNGRLSPFHPMADDTGIDLLIYDKKTGHSIPVQVKARTKTLTRHPKILHFQVRKATFKEEQHAFLLAVYIDTKDNNWVIGRAWLIPMRELQNVTGERADRLVLRPSIDIRSKDKYSKYRCKDMLEVINKMIADCEERGLI